MLSSSLSSHVGSFFHFIVRGALPGLHQHVEVDPVLAGAAPELGLAPVLAAVLRQHWGDEEAHLAEERDGVNIVTWRVTRHGGLRPENLFSVIVSRCYNSLIRLVRDNTGSLSHLITRTHSHTGLAGMRPVSALFPFPIKRACFKIE